MPPKGKNAVTIILRREDAAPGGHHGGAWKVAYADFVTAMMAFFLLMWLINATTEAQRRGLADYFSPQNVLGRNTSGSGRPFGGQSPFEDGAMVSNLGAVQITPGHQPVTPNADPDDTNTVAQPDKTEEGGSGQQDSFGAATRHATAPDPGAPPASPSDPAQARLAAAEHAAFAAAASALKAAVANDPALGDLAHQLVVDETPQGLRIQIVDQSRRPMFATGSSALDDRARALLQKVAPVLIRLTEQVAITGHTDATPYRGTDKTNWELSSERADATRRLLADSGLPDARIASVSGAADRDPLVPADPLAAANRRIAIVVLRRYAQ